MTKEITHDHVFELIERLAPRTLAYDWDNVGLQIGNRKDKTTSMLITLDITNEVIDEAIKAGANLIISHHPLFFNSIKSIDLTTYKGKMIEKIIQHNISIYTAHTNLDIANGGVNDMLCDKLSITHTKPLVITKKEKQYKLVVFLPDVYANDVLEKMGNAGAGSIGNYSHCAFIGDGLGTFKPNEDANPHVGESNKQHEENEKRIEVIVKEDRLSQVVQAMLKAHPYEEPAYDILELKQTGEKWGLGRVGDLDLPLTVKALCDRIKEQFNVSHVRVTGNMEEEVKKLAIVGGSGEGFIAAAKRAGADVYITGDMKFHGAQDAEQMGLTVIDAGHIIEKVMIDYMADYLQSNVNKIQVISSTIDTNPFQYY